MWWPRVLPGVRRAGARLYGAFHDPIDHVTGIEKRELLAHLAGDCDPFRMLAIKRGPGTRERPNLMPSSNPSRLMACVCNEHVMHLEYMWLHQGIPKRCGCGYWFELCPVAPLSNPSRLMACECNEHVMHLEYMWLHQGIPKRCGCGYWFELCPVAPLSNPSRLMACECNEHVMHLEYMWLHQGIPKRCGCGYWFELCPVPPL